MINVSPHFVKRAYPIEASARDGRFTRKCAVEDGEFSCDYGIVIKDKPTLRWMDGGDLKTPDDVKVLEERMQAFNSEASADDVAAWAHAAFWWLRPCIELYKEAVTVAKKFTAAGWSPNGPADERLAPGRLFAWDVEDVPDAFKTPIAGYDYSKLLEGLPFFDSSWPKLFVSIGVNIIGQTFAGHAATLVAIQILLKHCALFLFECTTPSPELIAFMKDPNFFIHVPKGQG